MPALPEDDAVIDVRGLAGHVVRIRSCEVEGGHASVSRPWAMVECRTLSVSSSTMSSRSMPSLASLRFALNGAGVILRERHAAGLEAWLMMPLLGFFWKCVRMSRYCLRPQPSKFD